MIVRELFLDMRQLAWLAGLMEGEGTFARATPAKPRRPTMSVGMADEDVVRRVCELWGTRLWTFRLKNPRYKPVHRTELVGGSAVSMMSLLRPHLCSRRQAQIDEAMVTYQPLRSIRHKRFHLSADGAEEFDRYWLAGLLEGEAYFGLNTTSKHSVSPLVELNSVDCEVIERVHRLYAGRYGVSVKIHMRPPRRPGHRPQYHIACFGFGARAIVADVEPLMGQRRRERIAALLGPAVQRPLIREARACYALSTLA